MTKRMLYVVRHAKSSREYMGVSDIDRPLKLRGIRNAYEMARRLKIKRDIPELVITSPANRAIHTALIFNTVLGLPYEKIIIDKILYEHSVKQVLQVVRAQSPDVHRLIIFGHNPVFSDLVNTFVKTLVQEIPTCGLVVLTFKVAGWNDISTENLIDNRIDFPKSDKI